jgi:hypothetical protein
MTIIYWLIALFAAYAVYTLYKRFSAGVHTVNDKQFSQAGVVVDFEKKKVFLKGREFELNQVTNVRTRPPLVAKRMAFDCVISLSDFKLPEHRITFASSTAANNFMQRLITAIEKAGGPTFR